ncbi:DNA methyltransferase [Ligilactobacillus saerimneri]|uniref:site-specific DNA-methyltransferase n=1 Tax=Ligilactobacillus saerimneri TaxID=228229 RepID=UPI0022A6C773|nr:site-specific DNA-methyltransferase [Ligilactobacillus saerimneri]MCZ0891495.1 DNA methyltransferase [Ligilactobacillus saerimneri]
MLTDNEKFNAQVKPNTAFLTELKSKLPEFFDREGNFDMGKFRQQLADKNVNELKDGYQLNFIGKDYARRQAGEMPTTVIVPDEEQNQGAGKDSHNLFFTGDNLEVLRHLQANYAGKVDVIYIDPPYNTGNGDFVYPDAFEYSDKQLHDMLGMSDDQIERLKSIQGKSSHSAWLTFMYPRLVLAKRLLSEDGILFVSIDDNEINNVTTMLNEIFGDSQYVGTFLWNKSKNPPSLSKTIRHKYEFVLAYFKNKHESNFFGGLVDGGDSPLFNGGSNIGTLTFPERSVTFNIPDGIYTESTSNQIKLNTDVWIEEGKNKKEFSLTSNFRWKQETLLKEIEGGTNIVIKSTNFAPRYHRQGSRSVIPSDVIGEKQEVGTNEDARKHIEKLIGKGIFSFPKPASLIKYLIEVGFHDKKNTTILDFFAGSATTADAVMQLNAEDGGHRKFIMVQLPEPTFTTNSDGKEVPTKGGKAAYDAGFRSIDEISCERIRRAAAKIKADNELTLPADFDGSFKHYRVVKPTKQLLLEIEDFDPKGTALFNDMLNSYASDALGVAGGATGAQTILTTWLAKDGYAFDTETKNIDLAGYRATLVNDNRLYLINPGWGAKNTEALLNQLGTYQLDVQAVVLFGYSFNIAELRELENGLKQVDRHISLIKRY